MELDEEFFTNFTSDDTRTSYQCDIKQFFKHVTGAFPEVTHLLQVERRHVIHYRNFLGETGGRGGESAAPKTIAPQTVGTVPPISIFWWKREVVPAIPPIR